MGIIKRDDLADKVTLNLIMLIDNSLSMAGEKIGEVNYAMPEIKKTLEDFANNNHVDINIRVISFSHDAQYMAGGVESGVPISDFIWKDLGVDVDTRTDLALKAANDALRTKYLGDNPAQPVVILVTDGYCNPDAKANYLAEIENMKNRLKHKGQEAIIRVAIGIGDFNYDELVEYASKGTINDIPSPLIFTVQNTNDLSQVMKATALSSIESSLTASKVNDNTLINIDTKTPSDDDFVDLPGEDYT